MRVTLVGLHYAEYSACLADALAPEHDILLFLERSNADNELGAGAHLTHPSIDVEYVTHVGNLAAAVKQAVHMWRSIRRFRPDIVHAQEVMYDSWALLLLLMRRLPLVLTVHDPKPHSGENRNRGIRRRYPLYVWAQRRRADLAITHGTSLAEELQRTMPRLAGRVVSIAHGVLGRRPDDHSPRPYTPDGTLLFLGRMVAYKGLPVFLDALEELGRRNIAVTPVLAGQGPSLADHRERAFRQQSVRVIDRYLERKEMLDLIDEAAVIVLPYLDGTQSGIALQAIGRGRPIVATRVGSLPEVVREGINGELVPPGDARALADVLEQLIDDPERLRLYAAGSARMGRVECAWSTIASHTSAAYSQTLRGRDER